MQNSLLTQDRIDSILRCAKRAPEGLFAEAGVYKGGICKLLAETFPNRTIIGFDTFEGLPVEQWNAGEKHKPKDFNDASYEAVLEFINCSNVKLIKGLFPDSAEPFINDKFAFVHVDFDFYEGIKACLDFFWSRLNPGGILVFDDFQWHMCPGVEKALNEFGKPITVTANYQCALVKY